MYLYVWCRYVSNDFDQFWRGHSVYRCTQLISFGILSDHPGLRGVLFSEWDWLSTAHRATIVNKVYNSTADPLVLVKGPIFGTVPSFILNVCDENNRAGSYAIIPTISKWSVPYFIIKWRLALCFRPRWSCVSGDLVGGQQLVSRSPNSRRKIVKPILKPTPSVKS